MELIQLESVALGFAQNNEFEKAFSLLDKSLEIDPAKPQAYMARGEVYKKKGLYDDVIADFSKAIEIEPKNAKVLFARALAYAEKHQYDAAISDLTSVVAIDSRNGEAYLHRGMAYTEIKKYRESISDFDRAMTRKLKAPDQGYLRRGDAYLAIHDYKQAILNYTSAIQSKPKNIEGLIRRGLAHTASEEYNEAIWDYNSALKINSKSKEAYTYRGNAWFRKGEYTKAVSDYNKALEFESDYEGACNGLAWLLATASKPSFHDPEKAVQLALRVCEITDWKNPEYLETLAAAYARMGDFGKAITMEEKAIDMIRALQDHNKIDAEKRLNLYRTGKPWPPDLKNH